MKTASLTLNLALQNQEGCVYNRYTQRILVRFIHAVLFQFMLKKTVTTTASVAGQICVMSQFGH